MTIESWGTGRKDYSKNIEYSTEPIIRGPQTQYVYSVELLEVAANSTTTVDVDIPADTVVMLYDFYLSANKNVYISLQIRALGTTGTYATIFKDEGYQRIAHPIPPGFPIFNSYRYIYANQSDEQIDMELSIAGIYTTEDEYYLLKSGGTD